MPTHSASSTKERLPLSQLIIYALGQFGWSLASVGVVSFLPYFYMPPDTGEATFPSFIYQGSVLGILTIIGIIAFGGRILDAITDPIIANWSDRSTSKMGKRKKLMALAIVPFVVTSYLVFMPISESQGVNATFLTSMILLFYISLTLYVIPYTALISELGHHKDDRMKISTTISVTWALGFAIGNSLLALQTTIEGNGYSPTDAFQIIILGFSILAFVTMLVPILFLDENRYAEQQISTSNVKEGIKKVFANHKFAWFTYADFMYWFAVSFITVGMAYFTTLIFGFDKEHGTAFLTLMFLVSFVLYPVVNILSKKMGKNRVLSIAFIAFGGTFLLLNLTYFLGLPKEIMFYGLAILSAFPMAAFGIIPNAIIADIVHEHEATTGDNQAGMFYAARNFMMKMGQSLAALIFPSLLLLGDSLDNPMGVIVAGGVALVTCLIGFGLFRRYADMS